MTLASRPPTLPDDLEVIAEISTRSEAVDQLDFPSSAQALVGALTRPGVDQARDMRLWLDAEGRPVAFALLQHNEGEGLLDGRLWMRLLPERRDRELAGAMIDWGARRLRELGAERGLATRLASGAGADDAWRIGVLEAHGFRPIRYFLRMERPLAEPVAPPRLPDGFALRQVAGDHEAEAWAELFNQSFIDHWNHHPLTVERLRASWGDPLYRRDLDLVLVSPEGTLAAFCACELDPEDEDGAGWIEVLGTRRGFRGIGLGRAALAVGLDALRRAGARVARLIVDAESPTGATRLYESAGFVVTRRSVRMARPEESA